ncbi:MAG: hypothetical protein K9I85_02895 [Saprospiraceae bacterium]|nr:hypothetical protein [Saprospiraceae bacterium]
MKQKLQEQLNQEEFNKLVAALSRVTILIAGSDGQFDEQEKEWAEKLTHIRSYNHPPALEGLYETADPVFSDQLAAMSKAYPEDLEQRNRQIQSDLAELNPILAKLDPKTGRAIYKSLKSFAKHIARSSGGFLGFGSISASEAKWIELPMINPIEDESEEE